MGSTGVVGTILLLLNPLVPDVSIPIESASAMSIDNNVFSSENKSSRLVLVPDIKGIFEPILDVGAKL